MGSQSKRGGFFHLACHYKAVVNKNLVVKLLIGLIPFIAISSLFFYFFESRAGGSEYKSYWDALQGIVILVFSGFDVKPPVTVGGYISSIAVMISGIVFVTLLIGDSAALLVESKLKGGKGLGKVNCKNHIMICNWNEHGKPIVDQLLSNEIDDSSNIVVVAELEESPYDDDARVEFVQGNPAKDEILEKAGIDTAKTAIVLGSGSDPTAADSRAILTALAIESKRRAIYTCVIVSECGNKKHLKHAHVDEVVCVSEMTDQVIVQASLNHGLSYFLSDLLTFSEGCEIYKVKIPEECRGKTFQEALTIMSGKHKVLLIGVQLDGAVEDETGEKKKTVCSPAWTQPLTDRDAAFVISESFPEGFEHP